MSRYPGDWVWAMWLWPWYLAASTAAHVLETVAQTVEDVGETRPHQGAAGGSGSHPSSPACCRRNAA